MKSGISTVVDNAAKFLDGVRALTGTRVMVGVPAEKTDRRGEGVKKMTNAALAYVHEHGAPEVNVPARPFLEPGIMRARGEIEAGLRRAGEAALAGSGVPAVKRHLHRVGLLASSSVKTVITEGIPPPLRPSSVEGRIARRKSKSWRARRRAEIAANAVYVGEENAATGIFIPLLDTGQLRNAVTYVLRKTGEKP